MTKVIPRESRKITYSSEIRKLKKVPFTEHQRAIVIGSVLGDGCLHPNWSKTNYTLKITRSEKQKAYLEWQYQNLQPFVLTMPRWYEPTRSYTLRTISHTELTTLYEEFYLHGKKILPAKLEYYIQDPLTLAVWFMDDGNAVRNKGQIYGYHINTQSFNESENKFIVRALKSIYDIESKSQKNNGYIRLYIGAKSKDKFVALIQKYIIPSMQYKLG